MSDTQKNEVVETEGNLSINEAASRAIDDATENDTPAQADTESSHSESAARASTGETRETAPTTGSEEESVDWDTLPPQAKKEYQKQKERYENLRSVQDRKETEWKRTQEKYQGIEPKAKQFDQIDHLYRTNPKVRQAIDEVYGIKNTVDPVLEADPLYKYMSDYQRQMEERLNPLLKFYETETQTRQQRDLDSKIDKLDNDAKTEFKTFFGREPSQAEMARIYETVTKDEIYNGRVAVRSTFTDEIINARIQSKLTEQSTKKNKTTKTSNVSPSKAVSNGKVTRYEDAIEMAMNELNMEF